MSSGKPAFSLALEDVKPVRTGSLPFKKRRFPRLALSELNNNEDNEADGRKSTVVACPDVAAPNAESLAALALVAAAASRKDANAAFDAAFDFSPEERTEPVAKHGFSSFYQQAPTKSSANPTTLSSALLAAALELQSLHDGIDFDATCTKKANRPPLTSPLPNGCHGRTARHNSYCRRQPYNGSHFCKSHYQSLVLSGTATEQELKHGQIVDVQGDMPEDICGSVGGSPDGTRVSGTGHPAVHHQDKRFTGAATEIRCKATTTRGRDCSYCAVNATKYCHLHATFDTNPPPRRGGASYANALKARESAGASEAAKSGHGTSKSGKAGKTDGPKRRNSSMSARRLSTTKNLEKHMEHAPYPLLSTLATDKWLNRKVIVSTGPLTNHVGVVEKWGNGWISVRLPGVGLHNRRSFELYLHPNPDSEGDSSNSVSAEKVASRVEVFDATKEGKKARKLDLVRVASTEEGDPPTPLSRNKPMMRANAVREVTPLTSCRVIGIDQSLPRGKGARRVSSIMFPSCFSSSAPATVPESPVPEYAEADMKGSQREKSLQMPKGGVLSKDDSKFHLSVKPTMEADCNGIPLVQSLMLSKERRSAKNKLGLLYGTAALERSRRSIHKPKRYEDTELISKKLKKRDRECEFNGPAKRHCALSSGTENSGSTPMISSSDEEPLDVPGGLVSV